MNGPYRGVGGQRGDSMNGPYRGGSGSLSLSVAVAVSTAGCRGWVLAGGSGEAGASCGC